MAKPKQPVGPHPPEWYARSGSEHGEQTAVFVWAQQNWHRDDRLRYLFAIPNGGSRGDTSRSSIIRGAALKAEGVKPGVPDVFLPVPLRGYAGLFIEMKKIGGTLSNEQKDVWIPFLNSQHYLATTCWGWQEAVACLTWYLELK